MTVTIRPATYRDVPSLAGIERAAGMLFLDLGMPEIASDDPLPDEVLRAAVDAGLLWVAVDDAAPVAYLLAEVLGDSVHIEQVTVHPGFAHQRIGARLIETCHAWAAAHGCHWLTLTTFRDVPWNAPYYRRIGFQDVRNAEMTAGLRAIVQRERDAGLDRWPRVVMRRAVDG